MDTTTLRGKKLTEKEYAQVRASIDKNIAEIKKIRAEMRQEELLDAQESAR